MKRDSKMSVLKGVIVTFLYFILYSNVLNAETYDVVGYSNVNVGSQYSCMGKTIIPFSAPGYGLAAVKVNGGVLNGYSTSMSTNDWGFTGYSAGANNTASTVMYYLIIDPTSKTVSYTTTVPSCVYPDDFGNYTSFSKTYYYCGPTGDASDVTNKNNWCTNRTGSAGSCTSPSNFTTTSCKYVISQEDVVLKSNQVWTVSGAGSKIDVESGASFVVNGDLDYKNGVDVESNATLNIGTDVLPSFGKIKENSTVVYSGPDNQKLKNSVTYSNLVIEKSGGTLTFPSGDVSVSGEFKPIKGKCVTTGSTFKYVGTNQTVAAFNYNNLNLGSGTRTYATNGTIGIAGSFSPSTGTNNVTGSTVEFNGTSQQTISAATFNNLTIKNSNGVKSTGNIIVKNQLNLVNGVLDVYGSANNYKISVENVNPSAIQGGNEQSFVKGQLSRVVNDSYKQDYVYPVGWTGSGYFPLTLSDVVTNNKNSEVSARILITGSAQGTIGNGAVLSEKQLWVLSYDKNYEGGSVSLSVPASRILAYNSIAGCNTTKGTYTMLKGTLASTSIRNSNPSKYNYYTIAKRVASPVTYVYNCDGSDMTNPQNWTIQNGTSHPLNFDIDDATWEIDCLCSLKKSLHIGGSNSKFYLGRNANFVVRSGVDLAIDGEFSQDSKITIQEGATVSIYGSYSRPLQERIVTIDNSGELNFYTDVKLERINFTNYETGVFNVFNGDVTVSQPNKSYTTVITNNGKMNFTNSNVNLYGGQSDETWPSFVNANGGAIVVDNTNSPGKSVTIGGTQWPNGLACLGVVEKFNDKTINKTCYDFQAGSSFVVKGCDVICNLYPSSDEKPLPNEINGFVSVVDGNFDALGGGQGGTRLTVGSTGGVYLYDTDGSGDGVLNMASSGGGRVNINGELYVEGMSYNAGGGGNTIDVNNGATAFIGHLGANLGDGDKWTTQINVKSGSKTYYCGNITTGADYVGTIEANGTLYYAQEYYDTDPKDEIDFEGDGKAEAVYYSAGECVGAYRDSVSGFLPVEMTLLYGICKNETIELHWQTASEKENVGFTILKSFDGINFEEIGFVAGAGTTSETQNYEYFDAEEKSGIVYYKVCQTDFDGKTKMSKIIAVKTCAKPSYNMMLNAQFSITDDAIEVIFENEDNQYFVTITDVTGRMFYSKAFKDTNSARINCPKSKGVYIISVSDGQQITSEKFIK